MDTKADPKVEVNRRLAGARYIWMKLSIFWREGLLSTREKLLIYNALIGSRLTYGLHTLPLKIDLLKKLDAFHMRGLRQILKLKPTHIDSLI